MNNKALIFMVSLLLNASSLYAVHTKKCPRAFNAKLNNIEKYNKFDVLNYAATFDYADLQSIDYFFNNELSIDRSFYLESTYDSICRYASLDNSRWFAQAQIKGTDKSPTLQIEVNTPSEDGGYVSFDLQAILPNIADKKDQYNFSDTQAVLSVNASNERWDTDFIYWINIANGKLFVENQLSKENIQLPSLIKECADYNHRDMVEKIFDNETLFSELNDQAAVLLGNWAIDVITNELMSLNDCSARETSFLNLQRLIKKINNSIGSRYDLSNSKSINNENQDISNIIDVLNKTGVRLWVVNNTQY